jgi:hypothetical protein
MNNQRLYLTLVILELAAFVSCNPVISLYSERAYNQATSLKVETLTLMNKATEPYQDHEKKIESLMLNLKKAYEYAKGRTNNELSARQWEIMVDPDKNLAAGFFRRWEEEGTLSKVFIEEAQKGLISQAFDMIIGLEAGKIRPEEARIVGE